MSQTIALTLYFSLQKQLQAKGLKDVVLSPKNSTRQHRPRHTPAAEPSLPTKWAAASPPPSSFS